MQSDLATFAQFLSREDDVISPLLGRIILDNFSDIDRLPFTSSDLIGGDIKEVMKAIEEVVKQKMEVNIVNVAMTANKNGTVNTSINKVIINFTDKAVGGDLPSLIIRAKDFLTRRNVIKLANDLQFKAVSGFEPGDLLESANKLITLSSSSNSADGYDVGNGVDSLFDYLEERKGKTLFGFSFGKEMEFLDKATRGLQKGRTYRVGAPSNMGKTQWTYGIINSLIDQGAKVVFFSLENDREMTMSNLIANRMGVNSWDLESGKVLVDMSVVAEMDKKLFIIDDTHELSEIFSKVLAIKPDVVMLDYIGLVNINKFKEEDMFTEYAKRVQQFVKKTRVSWLDLSNLANGQDDDEIVRKGAFYGSSYLKNNADVGIHLTSYKAFYETRAKFETHPEHQRQCIENEEYRLTWNNKKAITIHITKNRIGPASLNESYFVNFAKGGRFVQVSPAEKLQFE